jgi:hypothetical protein
MITLRNAENLSIFSECMQQGGEEAGFKLPEADYMR